MRIQGSSTGNTEAWVTFLSVKPGDHIVFSCWIKVDPLPAGYVKEDYAGGRIGFDLRWSSGVNYCLYTLEAASYPKTSEGVKANYVQFGTVGWVKRTIDFIIPADFYTTNLYNGATIPPKQINSIAPWAQLWSSTYGSNMPVNTWFADAELYINP